MAITTVYVVTKEGVKGIWTEKPECPMERGINPEPGTGQRRWRPVRGDLPGAPLILFKITVAVAVVQEDGQRDRAIAGVSMNCCFTYT
ncbi:TPA: hypothetical protein I8172_004716 [Citrobacter freundii]|nr:hypothetical protein [Citrobacter freundii]